MANRPVWFLDIDGVINAVSKIENSHYSRFNEWHEVEVNGYKIRYATDVIDFINRMSERVEIRFLTTWKDKAVEMLAPAVGLNVFPYDDSIGTWGANGSFGGSHEDPANRWWKLNVIMKHIEKSEDHFIWTDDDMTTHVRNYARRMADFEGLETCLLTPYISFGLEPWHLERIEKFVENVEKHYYPSASSSKEIIAE